MSILLYQMRQYQTALLIVEKLFRFIGQIGNKINSLRCFSKIYIYAENLDETLSWKICLLLAELYLCTFQVGRRVSSLSKKKEIFCVCFFFVARSWFRNSNTS